MSFTQEETLKLARAFERLERIKKALAALQSPGLHPLIDVRKLPALTAVGESIAYSLTREVVAVIGGEEDVNHLIRAALLSSLEGQKGMAERAVRDLGGSP